MSQQEAIQFMLERLKEPSTWRGFFVLLTALGVQIAPEKLDAVVTAGLGIAGLIGVFVPDKTNVVAALNFSDESNKSDNS